MKILILGGDGYLGFSLSQYLKARDCAVYSVDNLSRRSMVRKVGGVSLTQDLPLFQKTQHFDNFIYGSIQDHIRALLMMEEYDAIVHFAEQPSAPYSMRDKEAAIETLENNTVNTMRLLWEMKELARDTHFIKLGTMGEYGTPGIPIPEGSWEVDGVELPFPKQPGSIYHATKVMDSTLIEMLSRIWGFRCTDIMQGVVYGVALDENKEDPESWTRFDYDGVFGTALNRFVVQAMVDFPLTVYGKGGQTRGFLDIRDSMECIWLAIQNPPEIGEYRVFNQFAHYHKIRDLALLVSEVGETLGLKPRVEHIYNPRLEAEEHYYAPVSERLASFGYQPRELKPGVELLFECLLPYKDKVKTEIIHPQIDWRVLDGELESALEV